MYDGVAVEEFAVPIVFPVKSKPAPKAKWTKIPLDTKITKSGLIDIANEFGAENARLKNQLAKEKAK